MAGIWELRSDDQCWYRSHLSRTAPAGARLWSAEGEQLQLLEAILPRIAQLGGEGLPAVRRPTVVKAQRTKTPDDGLHRIEAGGLVGGDASSSAAELTGKLLLVVRSQPVAEPRCGHQDALRLRVEAGRDHLAWSGRLEHRQRGAATA